VIFRAPGVRLVTACDGPRAPPARRRETRRLAFPGALRLPRQSPVGLLEVAVIAEGLEFVVCTWTGLLGERHDVVNLRVASAREAASAASALVAVAFDDALALAACLA
jgi:hypothetical protein